jgi:Sec-independent protein translocase protein TatA
MDFLGIGPSEFFFIVFFCLIFFKPEELPGIVRSIITHIKKFRTMTSKVKQEIGDIYHREIESKYEEVKEEINRETVAFRSKLNSEYKDVVDGLSDVHNELDISKEINKKLEDLKPIVAIENKITPTEKTIVTPAPATQT